MKNGAFIAIVILVLIVAGLFLGKLSDNGYQKGYKAGQDAILEDWNTSDFLDLVRSRDGITEIIYYVNDKDPDAILDFVCDYYDNEKILDHLGLNYYSVR